MAGLWGYAVFLLSTLGPPVNLIVIQSIRRTIRALESSSLINMSFGFSVGDIITCSRLAAEIYDHFLVTSSKLSTRLIGQYLRCQVPSIRQRDQLSGQEPEWA